MADILVYLVDSYTKAMGDHTPECVDDVRFAAKLGEGFEQLSTMPAKKVKIGGKQVTVIPMILRQQGGARNALTVSRDDDQSDNPTNVNPKNAVAIFGGMLDSLTKSISTALARTGDGGSHLGAPREHSMPGLTIVSGELVGKAYDAGSIARSSGSTLDGCPFPNGSAAATRWRQGWLASGKEQQVDPVALDRIRADAEALAISLEGDPDAQVDCPYRPGTSTHAAWVDGFKRGGGRVE